MMPNITLNTLDGIQGIEPQDEYASQQAMNQSGKADYRKIIQVLSVNQDRNSFTDGFF